MATCSPVDLPLEAAILQLQAAFKKNGFDGIPKNLEYLLRMYGAGDAETARKALYKRLFCLLWYGSGKTMGAEASNPPTYVYPLALKSVVRARHSQAPKEWEDPVGDKVYHVTFKDLFQTKWPNPPKSRPRKRK